MKEEKIKHNPWFWRPRGKNVSQNDLQYDFRYLLINKNSVGIILEDRTENYIL